MLELDRLDFAAHSRGTWPHFTDGEMEATQQTGWDLGLLVPRPVSSLLSILLSPGAQFLEPVSLVCVRKQVVLPLAGKTHVPFYSCCGQILPCLLWEVRKRK